MKEDNSLCADSNLLLWLAILSNTPDSTRGHRTSFSLSPLLLFLLRFMPKTLNNLFLRVMSSDDDYTRNNYSLSQESTCQHLQSSCNLAMEKKKVHRLPIILDMQHLSITMIRFFLRLSKVRNFPCAAVQAKKATCKRTLVRHILFQGK